MSTRNLRVIENLKSELWKVWRHYTGTLPILFLKTPGYCSRHPFRDDSYQLPAGKALGVDFPTMDRHISKRYGWGLLTRMK